MALESSPQSVFALTPWRLVCGYPNGRKPTHESTCGACGCAAAFVLPAVLSSLFLLVHATAGGLPFYLPVVLLTPRRPITLLVTRAGVALKGLAQFSTATSNDSEAPMTRSRVKITKPVCLEARKLQTRLRFSHLECRGDMWRLWNI